MPTDSDVLHIRTTQELKRNKDTKQNSHFLNGIQIRQRSSSSAAGRITSLKIIGAYSIHHRPAPKHVLLVWTRYTVCCCCDSEELAKLKCQREEGIRNVYETKPEMRVSAADDAMAEVYVWNKITWAWASSMMTVFRQKRELKLKWEVSKRRRKRRSTPSPNRWARPLRRKEE